MDYEAIARALPRAEERTVVVFGDYCLDKYLYTDPLHDELSVETGLIARQFDRKELFAGVGGTISNNLRALGARVRCVGLVGADGEGWELTRALRDIGADTRFLAETPDRCTCTYTKPMQRSPDGTYSELGRLDFRSFEPLSPEYEDLLLARLEAALDGADAVIVADQFVEPNLGALTKRVRAGVCRLAKERPGLFCYADSRAFATEYPGLMVKCNDLELARLLAPELQGAPDRETLRRLGARLAAQSGRPAVITRGKQGCLVFEGESCAAVEAFPVAGPIDIVGAGDAFNAGFVLGLCLGLPLPQAATLGNCVSSITIQQLGRTGTASPEQVMERLRSFCGRKQPAKTM